MMHNDETLPPRQDDTNWVVVASSDNGEDVLRHVVSVDGFAAADHLASRIAALLEGADKADPTYYTQITLRGWRLEVMMVAPRGFWASESQQELASRITRLSN